MKLHLPSITAGDKSKKVAPGDGVALGIFIVSQNLDFQTRQHKEAKRRTERWLATHFITFQDCPNVWVTCGR